MAEKTESQKQREGCVALVAAVLVVIVSAQRCFGEHSAAPAAVASVRAAPAAPAEASNERAMTASDMGATWPFTVPAGTLKCVGRGAWRPIIFTVGTTNYAVNGTAKGRDMVARYDIQDMRSIWLDNPDIPGTKVSIGPIIELGIALCPAE